MKIRKSKKAIGPQKFSPPVGFQIAPSAPAGGGTNVAAMRPNFAFLPYNADAVSKAISDAKIKWRADNPNDPDWEFNPPNLFGQGDGEGGQSRADKCSATAGCVWNPGKQICMTFKGTPCTPGIPPVY